jgi:hypothetical protein
MGLLAGLCGPLLMWLMTFSHGLFLRLKLSPPWQLALAVDRRAAVPPDAEGMGEWLQRGSGFSARPAAAVGDCRSVYL